MSRLEWRVGPVYVCCLARARGESKAWEVEARWEGPGWTFAILEPAGEDGDAGEDVDSRATSESA